MMSSSEEAKRLAEIKAFFERKVKQLQEELDVLKSILGLIDAHLTKISFKPAVEALVPKEEFKQVIPIKTRKGRILADMLIREDDLRIVPRKDVKLNVNTPPFKPFFINRVLEGMVLKDKELVEKGELPSDKILSYTVMQDDDLIKEIAVKNFRERYRLREIQSSIRWTFERMLEKTSS